MGNPPLLPSVVWRSGPGTPGAWGAVSGATLVDASGGTLPVPVAADGSFVLPEGEWAAVIVHDAVVWGGGSSPLAAAPGAHAVLLPEGRVFDSGTPVVVGLVVEDNGALTVRVFAE